MTNQNKGFASMDKDKVKEIAAKGGHESHKNTDKSKGNEKSNKKDSNNK